MDRRKTYTYKWPRDDRPYGLALNCHMKDGELRYFDTLRGHMIRGEVIEDGDNGFKFRSDGFEPGIWEFKALTIEEFRRETWEIVENGGYIVQAIKTTDDLHEWYRKRFGKEAGLNYPDVLDN